MNRQNTRGPLDKEIDLGLLLLRAGMGISFVLLFILKQSHGASVFPHHAGRLWPLIVLSMGALLVACGYFTRVAASLVAASWLWAAYSGVRGGQEWFNFPVRDIEYAFLFAALAFAGPGKFSLDRFRQSKRSANAS
jgi:uncharacterized membrane protein YphA (DoxX/SURF4 family)